MYFVIYLSLGFWRRILEKYILFRNENIFLRLASILVVICKPKIFLKAWHPDLCGSIGSICVQIFLLETSCHFKLVSPNCVQVVRLWMKSHIKKKKIPGNNYWLKWPVSCIYFFFTTVSFFSLKTPENDRPTDLFAVLFRLS